MHRSRVYALIVDAAADDAVAAQQFWSAALGAPIRTSTEEPQFASLVEAFPDLVVAVQSVDDTPRYHLDIETDDVEAEVTRLTGLGATPVSQYLECHVLRAPSGHLLCVLPVESPAELFEAQARTWP